MAERRFYEFGRFRLDTNGHILFCGEQAVALPPKAADVLFVMVQNVGHVVEKETFIREV
jgi:DNA-binding winged helix-turn-helix (wHTH) protein